MNDVTSINHPKILNASGYLEKSEYKISAVAGIILIVISA